MPRIAIAIHVCLMFSTLDWSQTNVLTFHNDAARTGLNSSETILMPGNVNFSTFGKIFLSQLDGRVDAQPLYVGGVSLSSLGTHNVLLVATENDSVYALDADDGSTLWHATTLQPGEIPADAEHCSRLVPEVGITSTPAINLQTSPPAIYLVAMSKDSSGNYHQRLHALDLTTGHELAGGPAEIQAKYPGTGDNSRGGYVIFDPAQYAARAGLLLGSGGSTVYIAWTSHCDHRPYTGWIMAYSTATLAQTSVLNTTPNGSEGAFWGAGAGIAADLATGNLFIMAGNGTFDTRLDNNGFPINGDYGNGFLKISTASTLQVADYFGMYNTVEESAADLDLGSGGVLVLPDMQDANGLIRHLAIGAGKDSHIYLADRDNMGKFSPWNNNALYQEVSSALGGSVFSTPAYFNGRVYYGAMGDSIRSFAFTSAQLASAPSSMTSTSFPYPGATPSISSNGTANGIVWAVENASQAVLHAYVANNLSIELYNSNQAPNGRDNFGGGNKFMVPTVVNGKVYVGTPNGVAAFGLLSVQSGRARNIVR
jgi:hypothetical protein